MWKLRVSSKSQQTKSFCFHALSLSHPYRQPSFLFVMSTRSKTRSSLSSKVSESATPLQKPKSRTHAQSAHSDDMDVDSNTGESKENVKTLISKTSMPPPSRTRKSKPRKVKVRGSLRTIDCTCTKGNDGSPMILCSQCRIWYVSISSSSFNYSHYMPGITLPV